MAPTEAGPTPKCGATATDDGSSVWLEPSSVTAATHFAVGLAPVRAPPILGKDNIGATRRTPQLVHPKFIPGAIVYIELARIVILL